jgi:hypothetical protein
MQERHRMLEPEGVLLPKDSPVWRRVLFVRRGAVQHAPFDEFYYWHHHRLSALRAGEAATLLLLDGAVQELPEMRQAVGDVMGQVWQLDTFGTAAQGDLE